MGSGLRQRWPGGTRGEQGRGLVHRGLGPRGRQAPSVHSNARYRHPLLELLGGWDPACGGAGQGGRAALGFGPQTGRGQAGRGGGGAIRRGGGAGGGGGGGGGGAWA